MLVILLQKNMLNTGFLPAQNVALKFGQAKSPPPTPQTSIKPNVQQAVKPKVQSQGAKQASAKPQTAQHQKPNQKVGQKPVVNQKAGIKKPLANQKAVPKQPTVSQKPRANVEVALKKQKEILAERQRQETARYEQKMAAKQRIREAQEKFKQDKIKPGGQQKTPQKPQARGLKHGQGGKVPPIDKLQKIKIQNHVRKQQGKPLIRPQVQKPVVTVQGAKPSIPIQSTPQKPVLQMKKVHKQNVNVASKPYDQIPKIDIKKVDPKMAQASKKSKLQMAVIKNAHILRKLHSIDLFPNPSIMNAEIGIELKFLPPKLKVKKVSDKAKLVKNVTDSAKQHAKDRKDIKEMGLSPEQFKVLQKVQVKKMQQSQNLNAEQKRAGAAFTMPQNYQVPPKRTKPKLKPNLTAQQLAGKSTATNQRAGNVGQGHPPNQVNVNTQKQKVQAQHLANKLKLKAQQQKQKQPNVAAQLKKTLH